MSKFKVGDRVIASGSLWGIPTDTAGKVIKVNSGVGEYTYFIDVDFPGQLLPLSLTTFA